MKLLSLDNLQTGMILSRDIPVPKNRFVPLVRKDTLLTQPMLDDLQSQGVLHVHVKEEHEMTDEEKRIGVAPAVTRPVPGKPEPVVSPELRKEAVSSLKDLFLSINADDIHDASKLVSHVDEAVDQLVDSLLRHPNALINISDLKSYDDYTYHHSLSVAVLSLAIGQNLGFSKNELSKLGQCAMLHDIGKIAMPIEIIQKNGKLSDEELEIIKCHPTEGYRYLSKAAIGDDYIRQAVLYHHEKTDGTGYPFGAKGDEIPVWSRIISVADVYDALTSNRPYRQPMQPYEAVEYIMGGTGKSFDFEIVYSFVHKLELYPVGCRLELSNGQTGVVMSNENQLRPLLLLDTGEQLDLNRDRNSLNIVVRRVMTEPDFLVSL